MKIIVNVFLILLMSHFMLGCSKKEPVENASREATTPDEAVAADFQQTQAPADQQPEELTDAAPLKELEWLKGSPVTFESGKFYIVEFWATWCPPCKVTIPHLTEMQKKYKDKGLTIIGIASPSDLPVKETLQTVQSFVKKMGDKMDYTIAFDDNGYVHKNYMQAFNNQYIPWAFIVNGDGKIAWNGSPLEDIEPVLDMVIKGNFDPVAYAKQKAEAEAMQQKVISWYMDYFKKIKTDGLTEETKQIAANFIEKASADGLDAFAWNILTRVQETDQDIEAALKAAQKANELTEGNNPIILDTYGLALFTSGKISKAIEVQQKAVDLASDQPKAQAEFRQRLERYKDALGEQI